jgi:hypothetical protein
MKGLPSNFPRRGDSRSRYRTQVGRSDPAGAESEIFGLSSNAARGIATNGSKKTGRASVATTITRIHE